MESESRRVRLQADTFRLEYPEKPMAKDGVFQGNLTKVFPQKLNIDTKNGHNSKEPSFPRPIILGIHVSFRGCNHLVVHHDFVWPFEIPAVP